MRDVIIRKEGSTVYLGRQGENNAIRILIPVADLIAEYGSGTFTIVNKRTSDKDAYPCTTTQDSYYVYWPITSAETAYKGTGRFQLSYMVDGTIMKSITYKTVVEEGLDATASPPTPWQGWVDALIAQVKDISKIDKLAERITYSNSGTFPEGSIGKAIQTLENEQLTSEDISYTSTGTHTAGTIGAAVRALETKEIGADEVDYDSTEAYESGTVGYAIKNIKNDITAGDVSYSASATYTSGTVGAEINSIKSDVSDAQEDIEDIQEDIVEINSEISSLGSDDIAYDHSTSYTTGTVGKAVKDLQDKEVNAGEVSYNFSTSYESGTIGYAVKHLTPVRESHTISESAWTSMSFHQPFIYKASFTATSTLGTDTEVELVCDDLMLFATCGLCIGEISGQTVTLYSTDSPEEDITIKIDVRG